ncbi:BTAD domain-containing putative transcriptional regulator [Pyxidicoccus xibeiensis]|uniref:BTAD domain-containing putative transcriptional regulator n=1 Tax=Pyxidicoccus xibeiensis TaxID=2906759 RepID=UPI0020A7AE9A|nr:BTAD domain-containing putative transcriptional regulator [Pyxidicoccus xibeiensis]MCP3140356.1 AAA family ATPase [Pyxidicoccus xibeiensis]
MRVELLGGARVCGVGVEPRRLERKTAALLAWLVLEGETSRAHLAGLLWPESPEATARNNLSQALRRLREVLGASAVEGREALSARADLWVDARVLKESLARGAPTALPSQGELLAGLYYDDCETLEDWLRGWRARLHGLQQQALEARIREEEHEGRLHPAMEAAQRLLAMEPTSEEGFRHLMRLHYRLGDRAAALRVWRQCEEVLARELGVTPSAATRRLANELGRAEAPPPSARQPALPLTVVHPPMLVGREPEWARMEEAWAARRPMLVVGPAGVGKSRLLVDFARSRGDWLLLTARPGDFDVPFSTHARSLRTVLKRRPDVVMEDWVRRELSRLLPELAGDSPLPLPPPPEEKARFFAAIVQVLREALRGMAVVAYDDAHYSDRGSSELSLYLLSELQEEMAAGRFPLFLASQRLDEQSWGEDLIRKSAEVGLAAWVELGPLGPEAVRALLEAMEVPALEAMADDIARYTDGNPLFIVDTVKHLLESGHAGRFPAALAPPSRARAVIEQRLGRLSTEALRLARALAVARDEDVGLDASAALLEAPVDRIAEAWRELEAAALVRGGRLSHPLVAEVLLAPLPIAVREELAARHRTPLHGSAPH